MALQLYSDAALTTEITSLITQHLNTGMAVERQLFITNKDATKRYENIIVDPIDTSGTDETNYIQLAPDNAGLAGNYGAAGASLSMGSISDNNIAHAFWIKITTPSVSESQNKTDLQLSILYREFAV